MLAQVPLIATRQYADVATIDKHWGSVSEELAKLADAQPAFGNVIDNMTKAGPYAGLIVAVLPMVLQIGVNHGRVQPGMLGTVPKNLLAAQVEADMAAVKLAQMQQQAEAERAAQVMRQQTEVARKDVVNSQASQAATVVTSEPSPFQPDQSVPAYLVPKAPTAQKAAQPGPSDIAVNNVVADDNAR
jgi:hypothetical protein